MQTIMWEGRVTPLQSISHNGGQSFGVTAKLRREKFVQMDGSIAEVPVISGNAMRGILRDRGMLHMLRTLGYGVNEESGEVQGLSMAAFYFLFSGGALTSTGSRGIDIDEARKWQTLVPLVSVFGGAMGNSIKPGKIKVGKVIPICVETAHLLPESVSANLELQSVWEYLQEEMYTRTDDAKNDRYRPLLSADVRKLLDDEQRAAQRDPLKPVEETGQKQQMRYFVETIAAGTPMYWQICLDDVTDLEFEAFVTTMVEFGRMPYIGGKSGTGMGQISLQIDKWMTIDSRSILTGNEIDMPIGTRYADHLRTHGDEIRSLLESLK
jgi:CRISPR type IV-associated protein Csf2